VTRPSRRWSAAASTALLSRLCAQRLSSSPHFRATSICARNVAAQRDRDLFPQTRRRFEQLREVVPLDHQHLHGSVGGDGRRAWPVGDQGDFSKKSFSESRLITFPFCSTVACPSRSRRIGDLSPHSFHDLARRHISHVRNTNDLGQMPLVERAEERHLPQPILLRHGLLPTTLLLAL